MIIICFYVVFEIINYVASVLTKSVPPTDGVRSSTGRSK